MSLFAPRDAQTDSSLEGTYAASPIKYMIYGRGTSQDLPHLLSKLSLKRAYIITGTSLSTKTPIISDITRSLGSLHIGTFSKIGQHAPLTSILEATDLILSATADVLISIGGGSPIDSAKAIAYQIHERTGRWIPSIAVPTTLSVAETTMNAGFTNEQRKKVAVSHEELVPKAVVYDGDLALYTPTDLWTSTGIRALDHAIELLYHPLAAEIPTKRLALSAIADLFQYLPLSLSAPCDADVRQRLFLAAYASLFPFLYTGGVGLSHSIGHALGATYSIPHGITSCLTLAPVLALKARTKPAEAGQIARAVEAVGMTDRRTNGEREGNGDERDAVLVSEAVRELVRSLGHAKSLRDYGVPDGDEEAIASHALVGGREHPDFDNCVKIVRDLY